jgi:uncharacterized protein YukE
MDNFKVDLTALEGFADQLDARLEALRTTRQVAPTIPLGGDPAWEGQALWDAYRSRTNEVERLLETLRTEVETAITNARDQVRQVRGTDQNSAQNNQTNENAMDGVGGQGA